MYLGPVYNPSPAETAERRAACQELADFCGVTIEEMFPEFTPTPQEKLWKRVKVYPDSIVVSHEDYIEFLGFEQFVTLDKYPRDAIIVPNEVGRWYGKPVLLDAEAIQNIGEGGYQPSWRPAGKPPSGGSSVQRAVYSLDPRKKARYIHTNDSPSP